MNLVTLLAGAAVLAVVLTLVGMIRDARKTRDELAAELMAHEQDVCTPDNWRRRGVL